MVVAAYAMWDALATMWSNMNFLGSGVQILGSFIAVIISRAMITTSEDFILALCAMNFFIGLELDASIFCFTMGIVLIITMIMLANKRDD